MKKIIFLTQLENIPLEKETIHVTILANDTMNYLLSEEEKAQFQLYRFPKDAQLFARSRTALRTQLAHYLQQPPDSFLFKKGPHGKLFLPSQSLHFNISHSWPKIALAFSPSYPVGIDIESLRPLPEMNDIISDCFSEKEKAYVERNGVDDRMNRFWHIWCRKEACIKARGSHLDLPLDSIVSDSIEEWSYLPQIEVWVKSMINCDYALTLAYQEVP